MTKQPLKIQIWSDVMCPFCYIGKKNFEKALTNLSFKESVEVEWKSFQLDPTLTSNPTYTSDYLVQKKGFTKEQGQQMSTQVANTGKQAGIDFRFDKAQIVNTFTAHRLLHLSKKHGVSNDMEELLFEAHFTNGDNIADADVLVALAEKLGIDAKEARKAIESDVFDGEIRQDIAQASAIGVRGVPFFVVDGKYGISGAQPAEAFTEVLEQVYSEKNAPLKDLSADGMSCGPEGCEV